MKAQIKQVFIYLGALFIIAALITIGFRSIGDITGKSCTASQKQFKTTLTNALDANRGPGNAQKLSINAPCDTNRLCAGTQPSTNASKAINATLQADTDENIFLIQNEQIHETMTYDDLQATPVTCTAAASSTFDVTIRGRPGGLVTIQ